MIIIRPIAVSDLDTLHNIAMISGSGFTSLPDDRQFLTERINHSVNSFDPKIISQGAQSYLFVMEDTETGEVVGTSGIEAYVGKTTPLYHHRLGQCEHAEQSFDENDAFDTLTLCNDLTGSTEICSLYLSKRYRFNGNGRFLSRFRFLFMAEHPQRFSKQVIAEMRGYADENDQSPFWSWFKEKFCNIDFTTSNYLLGIGDLSFVADNMPTFPVYKNQLSQSAQRSINQVHPDTRPALALLKKEGFKLGNYIGVNDAGPAVNSPLAGIKTVVDSNIKPVKIGEVSNLQSSYLVCNDKVEQFRAGQIHLDESDEFIVITEKTAQLLHVSNGDKLRFVS